MDEEEEEEEEEETDRAKYFENKDDCADLDAPPETTTRTRRTTMQATSQ